MFVLFMEITGGGTWYSLRPYIASLDVYSNTCTCRDVRYLLQHNRYSLRLTRFCCCCLKYYLQIYLKRTTWEIIKMPFISRNVTKKCNLCLILRMLSWQTPETRTVDTFVRMPVRLSTKGGCNFAI